MFYYLYGCVLLIIIPAYCEIFPFVFSTSYTSLFVLGNFDTFQLKDLYFSLRNLPIIKPIN